MVDGFRLYRQSLGLRVWGLRDLGRLCLLHDDHREKYLLRRYVRMIHSLVQKTTGSNLPREESIYLKLKLHKGPQYVLMSL